MATGNNDINNELTFIRAISEESVQLHKLLQSHGKIPLADNASPFSILQQKHYDLLLQLSDSQNKLLNTVLPQLELFKQEKQELLKENQRLQRNSKRIAKDLQRALGITSKSMAKMDCDPDDDKNEENNTSKSKVKKRGAPEGHRGASRKTPKPEEADKTEIVMPPQQCSCGCSNISITDNFDTKYIEDLPPVTRYITLIKYLRGECTQCGKTVRHEEAVKGPPTSIGPNLATHLSMLNKVGGTFRKISDISTGMLGIPLSASGVLGIVQRMSFYLEPVNQQIADLIPDQPVLNGDETGWKINGKNGYIWTFCNKNLVYFHYDHSRAATVVEGILGKDFDGIVICDFYGSYNFLKNKQRCLIHLLRDLKKEREILKTSVLLKRFEEKIREFIQDGLKIQQMEEGPEKEKKIKEMKRRLKSLAKTTVTKGTAETLRNRFTKYRDDIMHFITHPDVEYHNNRAERALRPLVISRKLSFGSNTEKGARRHCALNSIIETCKLRNIDPITFMRTVYESKGENIPSITDPPAVQSA